MMKLIINIFAFFSILAIPFALSSQTRKAIPAGRYEALSGVKNSRASKNLEIQNEEKKDTAGLFWNEVLKRVPENTKGLTYFSNGKVDSVASNVFTLHGLKELKRYSEKTNIVFSDNLKRDLNLLSELTNKKSLVVLKDQQELKDVMNSLDRFEVLLFQVEADSHYFLLQLR